ncbi:ZMYND12, partial [Symbiodinium pilosum]
ANLGLRRLKIAEEFLSLANWNILKHPQASSSMMSNLQRNFGRLYAAQQRYNEAGI